MAIRLRQATRSLRPRPRPRTLSAMSTTPPAAQPSLARVLGPIMATAVVVGTVIGSGVFKKPQVVAENVPYFGLAALVWVLGGILARRDLPHHEEELKKHNLAPIDIVVGNLYPFVETVTRQGASLAEAQEQYEQQTQKQTS